MKGEEFRLYMEITVEQLIVTNVFLITRLTFYTRQHATSFLY